MSCGMGWDGMGRDEMRLIVNNNNKSGGWAEVCVCVCAAAVGMY